MQDIDYILDFVVHLGREMLECGANLERVNMSIEVLCKSYNLREVNISLLNNSISVSARNAGEPAKVRQEAVPINGIHLERLRRLNNLSYRVCQEKPKPEKLEDMLFEALMVPNYPTQILLLGYIIAMTCLCRLFGGGIRDIIVADMSTVLLFFLSNHLAGKQLNRIITNVVSMFIAGVIALLFVYIGFAQNLYAIIITNAFYLIPGIPMVNSVRNILCGNEMNGILELLKVILEVLMIVAGLFIAYFLFGQWYTLSW